MENILETEKLILRRLNVGDTEFIIRLLNTEGWLKFIGDRNVKTREDARDYLVNGPLKSYEVNGFGLSLVALKDGSKPIGICGLIRREKLEGVDIGFAFLPEFMGKGYAYEISAATLKYAKDALDLPYVLAITLPGNTNSIKLLKKLGMQFQRKLLLSDSEEVLLFKS